MKDQNNKYEQALKQVRRLREFYQHVFVYIIFIIVWLLFKDMLVDFIITKTENTDSGFLSWLRINIVLVPVLWGIGILIQGLCVNNFSFLKKWEHKKVQELMGEDQNSKMQRWE